MTLDCSLFVQRPLRLIALMLVLASAVPAALAAEANNAAERRLLDAASYLASDELDGRGVGTEGLDEAAEYIAKQFREMGLKTELFDGSPFQKFSVTTSSELGPEENNQLVFQRMAKSRSGKEAEQVIRLKLGDQFTPLAVGGSGKFDAPLLFAGYGITAKTEEYDDYAGVDAKGKAVIILRHEPQQENPHSVFDGTKDSVYAAIARKVSNAYEHGAAAVILVTDEVEIRKRVAQSQQRWQTAVNDLIKSNEAFRELKDPTLEQIEQHRKEVEKLTEDIRTYGQKMTDEYDPLFSFTRGGEGSDGRDFPVFHISRAAANELLEKTIDTDLATLERAIDKNLEPQSRDLAGWRAVGQTDINRKQAEVKNVVAVLEGEGSVADETVVIGAHYDHLGLGGEGSFVPNVKEIHNGADDNASGTAALLEIARMLSSRQQKLPRRVVFIAFTGEERGLLGSSHYVRQPLVPLEDTVAMLNMDMVGRLKDNKLVVYGTDTATTFDQLVDKLNEKHGFELTKQSGGFGPSDHAAFYAREIPVLHFFTGSHEDYHRPSDDTEKLNVPGMRQVAEMVADAAVAIAQAEGRPQYVESKRPQFSGGDRPYFGSVPDFTQNQPGYAITATTKGSPAQRAGIRGGDVIVQFGDSKIGNLEDFDSALRKYKAGDRVPVTVLRDGKEVKLEVTLDPPK